MTVASNRVDKDFAKFFLVTLKFELIFFTSMVLFERLRAAAARSLDHQLSGWP
ncbi:hypothetical protein NLK61_24345 [Pseudomonas fuscovaginae UPB0736]|uniref:hypothetical protein n=1 Tax=Pseudomonas asplenii TaxID=53407 RepID=UPI00030551A8|nr:hypothetical protein [Pseudomonas fuscovaginae]UUQ64312.1 hypothetical protein NLK61_24345 [Pseudomonas fuscovaginae UPB0736]